MEPLLLYDLKEPSIGLSLYLKPFWEVLLTLRKNWQKEELEKIIF
jgi:hypothetical protein